jgi:guanine nucleotide-binding protein subunit alpha
MDEPQETLNTLCGDMIQLWQDAGVRDVLKRRKIRLEEGSGFFLNDLQRVTSLRYMPSDGPYFFSLLLARPWLDSLSFLIDDVLKARLKTVGVAEYRFEMEVPMSRDTGTEWRIVDVGGSRSQVSKCLVVMLFVQAHL